MDNNECNGCIYDDKNSDLCEVKNCVYQELALEDIKTERKRQDAKWGEQNHHPLMWLSIIGEEYGEMCKAFNEYSFTQDHKHIEEMIKEAIQVAACCVAMIECLDRQAKKGLAP